MTQALNIDLRDPAIAQMLGTDPRVVATGKPREVVQLAGDAPDPTHLSSARGLQSTHNLIAGKQEVLVLYKDLVMTIDVYAVPGEPLKVHMICPRCHKLGTISGDRKAIDFEPLAANPAQSDIVAMGEVPPTVRAMSAHGRISIEPFECAWEIGDDRHVAGSHHTGVTLCRQKLAIDNNRAKDA